MAAIGAWLGWAAVVPVVAAAALLGVITGTVRLVVQRRSDAMAFGPCLVVSALIWMVPTVQNYVMQYFD